MMRLAVLSDIHFMSAPPATPFARRGEYGDTFLLRAVHRFNRFIKPDAVLVAGDLINDPNDPDAGKLLTELKKTLDLLTVPYRVIPGNHDPAPEVFYNIFAGHQKPLDVGQFRILPFADPETPINNACRRPEDLDRMRQARENWPGELIALQHVPVGPADNHPCEYNFDNADAVLEAMKKYRFNLCISGHEHAGLPVREWNGITLVTAPGLCESPFSYLILDVDETGAVSVTRENLAMDPALKLEDHHVHTTFAYCCENLTLPKTGELAELFGLAKLVYTEHSAHLLFLKEECWQRFHFDLGAPGADPAHCRMEQYFRAQKTIQNGFELTGMEVDYDCNGKAVLLPDTREKLSFINGAVHALASDGDPNGYEAMKKEFMQQNEAILKSGVNALVHPFRIFSFRFNRIQHPTPEDLFDPLVQLLKKYHTAAEINFHCNHPEEEFFSMCIKNGIKISLGSDTHNLYEVGEFYPHVKLLDKIAPGWRSNPEEILLQA